MSLQTEILGYSGWVFALLFVGWLAGLGTVAFWDRLRAYEKDNADRKQREAVLAEGVANQARSETTERGA